ncbi:HAD family phosphatase [Pseudomonas lalucatii]|uniref:HAD family phosphatase n=1 Tax=Pseudomonas lalucatii TaxID=1424203 RepID=A0ABS5PX62_9PSED|nr:HAD family phosphatase [Pseudomonas lalucatii]MBS7661095.1 HAD family phosphatase [Pseudomonas lalucatii]
MPTSATPPAFSALLFGLSGCLVDFGARTLPLSLQRLYPEGGDGQTNLEQVLRRTPQPPERRALEQALGEAAGEHAEPTPGASALLDDLYRRNLPCAWLDELPHEASIRLAEPLPGWLPGIPRNEVIRPWPAPDACWHALMRLQVTQLDGCVLISGEPRLLQAGLNAGLWTIGLAACGPLCGQAPADWRALDPVERDRLRTQATLTLYRLGVHSVIDQLTELGPCLADLSARRQKGEKP